MPQTIKEGVVVTVISGVISATILGVVGLLLGAVSDGRVVRGMGGLTSDDLSAYAKKEEIPDTGPTTLIYRSSFTVRENREHSEPLWQEADFCFLTRFGGSFAGVGELIELSDVSGGWVLNVKTGSNSVLELGVACVKFGAPRSPSGSQ